MRVVRCSLGILLVFKIQTGSLKKLEKRSDGSDNVVQMNYS